MQGKLNINGLEIDSWVSENDQFQGEDVLSISLPDHMVIDKKNVVRWMGEFEEEDAQKLEELLRLDADQFANKKLRIMIQVLGPKAKTFR